jgi:hypothetical protein
MIDTWQLSAASTSCAKIRYVREILARNDLES